MTFPKNQTSAFCLALALALGSACASSAPSADGSMGGRSTGGASAGSPPVSQAGSLSQGGGPDAGQAGSGGATAGAMAQAGGGGASGGAGGGGAQAGGAGAAGSGGAAQDPRAAAQVLDGFALLKPCKDPNARGCCCEETPETENQHITKQFGGDPNVTYNVKLRIAGVAERYWYAGGQLDQTSQLFYVGGLPTIHSQQAPNNNLSPGQGACKIHPPETDDQFKLPFTVPEEIRPTDGCYNGFNIFAMTVSSPAGKQSYYLNYTNEFDGADRQPHSCYENDYTVTVPIPGGAKLDFYTIDGDHHQVANSGTMQVPNVKTKQPYAGNFLEFEVIDVTVGN
jgi:hypothetical protein